MYCPPGFADSEDGAGNIIDGGWRSDEENCTSFTNISQTSSNRYLN